MKSKNKPKKEKTIVYAFRIEKKLLSMAMDKAYLPDYLNEKIRELCLGKDKND